MAAPSLGAPSALVFVLFVPVTLSAQEVDRAPQAKQASTVQVLDGKLIDQLPLDRIRDALILLPGVGIGESSGISLRGARPADAATYLDGVPINPGYRKSRVIFDRSRVPAPGQGFLDLGTNALSTLQAVTGPLSSALGQGQAGVVLMETLKPGGEFDARGSLESDRLFGSRHGPGIDRVQGLVGGRLLNRLRVLGAATFEGRESAESGPGALDDPIFLSAGVDTTVAVPSSLFDPFADTVYVNVSRFAVARGRCEAFSTSNNGPIADNYGEECRGVRIPATGASSYQLLGKLDYELGARATLWLTGAASRNQFRYFEPSVISVPLAGNKATSHVLTAGLRHVLGLRGRPLTLSIALSLQRDRTTGGPLSAESERDSQDGFFLSGLDFLYDMKSFPINEELIANIRNNTPGSRRSPLDLENTSQYALVNRYRDSPYGLDGGPESGGPSGRLMLLEEKRTVGVGSVEWQVHRHHTLRAGFELTRYAIAGYSHQLTSQAYSDAFLADPTQAALYVEDQVRIGSLAVAAGVRYDRFRSDAARPFVLDTVASSPGFMTYTYFPVPSSYGSGGITFNGLPLVRFVSDETHGALSPRIIVAFAASRSTTVRAGVARQSQMPDLSLILSGINTDLRVTNTDHVFGNDLDLERTTIYEIGMHQVINPRLSLDASLYTRELDDQAVPLLVTYPDPSRLGQPVDLRQVTSLGLGRVTGVDARLDLRIGLLRGSVGYAFQDAYREFADPVVSLSDDIPLEDSRPHTLTGALALEVPSDWGRGIVGGILRHSAVFGSFRFASGTAYTRCPAQSGNESVLSGESCNGAFDGEFLGSRLPSTKHLDLRITRGFQVAGRELVAYLDGRNVLNFENVLHVYAVSGTTRNPVEARQVFSQDSAGFAAVGIANGIYGSNGELDLDYGGAVAGGCANFLNAQFSPAAPDCVYLIRAEERYGDGDHIFTLAEQRAASEAAYRVARGRPTFLGAPRRLRIGLEVRF